MFNTTSGINDGNLKEKILNTLKKADGTPIDEIKNLFKTTDTKNKIQNLFGNDVESASDLIKKLDDDNVFKQIFEVAE